MPAATDFSLPPRTRAYDRAAPFWAARMARLGYPAAYAALVTGFGLAGPAARAIDIGCGAGDLALAYIAAGGRAAHLSISDPSRRMLDLAGRRLRDLRLRPRLHLRPLAALAADRPYDLILCAHVLEHGHDLSADLARLGLLLRPGGRLLLVLSKPHWCNRLIWLRWRHRSFAPATILTALHKAGLACLATSGLGTGAPGRTSHAYLATRS
jgi:2-polyprenyl-3-methyl-5-hydroxy-6-metoxy-1,4-benzoquinol methylase